MSELFKPVDSSEENAIIAAATASRRKGPDFSIRTATHWFTLNHTLSNACSVERHGENIPDTDKAGKPYDKKRGRITVEINGKHVCRWCFIGSLDESDASDQ